MKWWHPGIVTIWFPLCGGTRGVDDASGLTNNTTLFAAPINYCCCLWIRCHFKVFLHYSLIDWFVFNGFRPHRSIKYACLWVMLGLLGLKWVDQLKGMLKFVGLFPIDRETILWWSGIPLNGPVTFLHTVWQWMRADYSVIGEAECQWIGNQRIVLNVL